MSNLCFENLIDGMQVVYRGHTFMAARRGATAKVVLGRSDKHYMSIKWNTNKFRFSSDEIYKEMKLKGLEYEGQMDGRYCYEDFYSAESEKGQAVLKEVNILSIEIGPFNPCKNSIHYCPLCGSVGDDLVFRFYCSNNSCKNFQE